MTGINWGLLQPVDAGAAFQQGLAQGRARRVEQLTGEAINALLRDPSAGAEQISALAKLAPKNALAVIQFQREQEGRQRDTRFRAAQADYLGTFGPEWGGGANALSPPASRAPASPGAGVVGADGGPGISMAPPPPNDWRENLGPAAVAALAAPGANGVSEGNAPVTPYLGGRPLQAIDLSTDLGRAPSTQGRASMVHVDPDETFAAGGGASQGFGAETGATGQYAPGETSLPPSIARAAQSPNMAARNRAFMEMAKIDPLAAMKIDSEMRDATLDRLEDADKAYRLAVARLPRVTDDYSYQQVLSEVDAILQPLGMNIRDTVPATYPGPEGTRQLLMQAMDAQQQLAAIDRRFSAEARAADIEADNERADRNTDSLIADRAARTGIAARRADTADQRERRIASGRGGKPRSRGRGASVPTAVNPATGERLELRGGKWVPAK